MTKAFCDMCGCETDIAQNVQIQYLEPVEHEGEQQIARYEYRFDLCNECAKKLVEMIQKMAEEVTKDDVEEQVDPDVRELPSRE